MKYTVAFCGPVPCLSGILNGEIVPYPMKSHSNEWLFVGAEGFEPPTLCL